MNLFTIHKMLIESLFKKPITTKYPLGPRKIIAKSRGSIAIEVEKCIFCGICQKKCPTQAIAVVKEDKKWSIDRMRCIVCNACVEQCPKKCLLMTEDYTGPYQGSKKDHFSNA